MVQRQLSSETPLLPLRAAGASDRGRVRVRNEDAFALCDPPNPTALAQLGRLFILADGVGGQTAGAVASQLAVAAISARYYDLTAPARGEEEALSERHPVQHLDGTLPGLEAPLRHIRLAFATAHARLHEDMAAHREHRGMATTCVAAIVKGNQLALAHVGDSRAYLIRSTLASSPLVTRLTADHSMAAELLRLEALSLEQAQHSPSRHILTRVLGGEKQNDPGPDLTTCRLQSGDRVVLCCDGLWDMVSEEHLALVAQNTAPDVACRELIQRANKAGGKDNISVIILSFGPET